jgi:lipopolysaccharide biosynthesis glycosyltransferase
LIRKEENKKQMSNNQGNLYNIAVTPNSAYFNYLIVLFESLLVESNPDKKFHIFVLYHQLMDEEIALATDYVTQKGSMIDFIYIDGEKYKVFPKVTRLSVETYFRLEVQDLLPPEVDRLLYLDVDMLVCGDIEKLYHTDFDGKYLVACGFSPRCEKGDEFNAGMLLMNIEKLRKELSFERYVEIAKSLNMNFYADQGLLNYYFGENGTIYVPKVIYNFTSPFYRKFRNAIVDEYPEFTFDDIVIIHFAGPGFRPWQASFSEEEYRILSKGNLLDIMATKGYILDDVYMDILKKWWDIAKNTPVYNKLLLEMSLKKNEILEQWLDVLAESKEYRIGYRIMRMLRKITGKS